MFEFKLPDVGEGIHEAEVLQWLVAVGDPVKQDQPVVEIQTDKAIMELPSPVAGRVEQLAAAPGSVVHVGEVLIVIAPEDDRRPTTDARTREPTGSRVPEFPSSSIPSGSHHPLTSSPAHATRRVLAAPAVRKMALELGIDLADVPGSGPAGRVLPEDVRQYADGRRPTTDERQTTADQRTPNEERQVSGMKHDALQSATANPQSEMTERVPLQGLRRRIAERMEQAWRVPHVTSFETVEVARLVELKQQLAAEAERRGVRLTYTALLVKIVVQALKEHPYFNASLDMERHEILVHRQYHIGIATAVPDGLVVPVVRHADRLTLLHVAAEIQRLSERARERKLNQDELSGSTFTITNFGSFGGQQGTPIINPPEAAILGFGRIDQQPVVVEGRVEVRPLLPLALSFDHRLIDGAAAAQFLVHVKTLLHRPDVLMLDLT